jgi:glutathione S-transferase
MLFQAAVPVVFGKIGDAVPKEFIEDRRKLMGGGDFAAFIKAAPLFAEQLRAQASLLEAQLGDGRTFLLGAEPSLADFAAYHPVWFLRAIPPAAAALAEFPAVGKWAERVAAIGHGRRSEIAPAEALTIAKAARPLPGAGVARGEPNGLAAGERVNVVPDDYGFDPVGGELVAADVHEIAVRRKSPETGEVVVHFPRAGFRVVRAPGG